MSSGDLWYTINVMKTVLSTFFAAFAAVAPIVDVVAESVTAPKKVAVFVLNRTRVPGMDDETEGVRDRLSASLAEVDGLSVVDSALVADTYKRWKTTVAEEKAGVATGVFSGASMTRLAEMLNCDYLVVATIVDARGMKRNMNGRLNTVYTLRMTTRVLNAQGESVTGMPAWTRQYPVLDAADSDLTYYNILIDEWIKDAVSALAQTSPKWRESSVAAVQEVDFSVTTSIDKTITELESCTKGVNGEQLAELRRVTGGATVELDGAVIGSAPGTFKARPGLHQLVVRREWMKPYSATIKVVQGSSFDIALEMSDEGLSKWGRAESLRADLARRYAEAAMARGIKLNLDTTNWRDVSGAPTPKVIIQKD